VDAIGGRYGVMNRRDGQQGSVFWFEIPYKPDQDFADNLAELSVRYSTPQMSQSVALMSPIVLHHSVLLNILLVEE
jgi:hypothetical protein